MRTLLLLLLGVASLPAGAAAIQPLDDIRGAVNAFVSRTLGDSADTEYAIGRLDPRLRLPACTDALATRNVHAGRSRGPMSVEVRCAGAKPWVLYVPVEVVRFGEVVVTRRPVSRGQPITTEDLGLERRRLGARHADYFAEPQHAVGQIAIRSLAAGQVVSRSQLRPRQLVRRGDQVVLSSDGKAVTVRVKGEALEDGAAGERISVLNLSSERVVQGVVTASGEVVVRRARVL
ncbi:MAG: flagellar basal body P-ring formation chaperone FlgA [Gammaproteobacteria bacterium]